MLTSVSEWTCAAHKRHVNEGTSSGRLTTPEPESTLFPVPTQRHTLICYKMWARCHHLHTKTTDTTAVLCKFMLWHQKIPSWVNKNQKFQKTKQKNNEISHRIHTQLINSHINTEKFNECVTSWRHSYCGNTSILLADRGQSSKIRLQVPRHAVLFESVHPAGVCRKSQCAERFLSVGSISVSCNISDGCIYPILEQETSTSKGL